VLIVETCAPRVRKFGELTHGAGFAVVAGARF
jgi:hypothetical protein